MNTILTIEETRILSKQLHQNRETIVLAGGCFDILHIGHIRFLTEAKKQGDFLLILLESDETVKRLKGPKRPIHTQHERAEMLIALKAIDAVCLLPPLSGDRPYDELVLQLKPAIIATTKGDSYIQHKKRQVNLLHAKLFVAENIENKSTSKLISILENEL